MEYKGLPLFVEACEILRREALPFEISVVGKGALGSMRARLDALGARIVNRWINEEDVPTVFKNHDVVVVSSTEASQSGVIAVGHAFGLIVVATPVGGMVEQVVNGQNGITTESASPDAVAAAMRRLILEPALRETLRHGVERAQEHLSMERFLDMLGLDSVPEAQRLRSVREQRPSMSETPAIGR